MKTNVKYNVALLAVSIVIILVMVEIVLRLAHVPHKIASGWAWHNSPRRSVASFSDDTTNEFGFRGQAIKYDKDDYVVILLGDSQVEAATSPPEKMPEKQLQKYLSNQLHRPVKVFSLAVSAFGQDQELLALETYYKKYRADLVLVWATPTNDFRENAFPALGTSTVAGRIKPTFKLVGNELLGPYFESDFYYKNSAILHLIANAYARLKGISLEQMILNKWMQEMPSSHEVVTKNNLDDKCTDLLPTDKKSFSDNWFDFKPESRIMLLLNEDYYNSRSNYSPFLVNRSPRDNYLVEITKSLYDRIRQTAKTNNSEFKVFFPKNTDPTYNTFTYVKCVQYSLGKSSITRAVKLDEFSLLNEIIAANDLLLVGLQGGKELSFSKSDLHLSDIGNERVMTNLAKLLAK